MDNKLSELSKPKAFVVTGGKMYQDRAFMDKSTAERSKADRHDGAVVEPLYSQEYVSALEHIASVEHETACSLVTELSAARERIAELERANQSQDDHINQQQDRIDSLENTNAGLGRALGSAEKRLATPVRLPDESTDAALSPREYPNLGNFGLGYNAALNDCKKAIRAAGFSFTVEGDE